MRFEVLGPLQISGADGPVRVPGGRSATALCWLIANANESISFDSLVPILWEVPPASAAAKTRVLVRSLALQFPPETLQVGSRVRLVVPDDGVDVWRFERLIADAHTQLRADDAARVRVNLEAALALWRGEPYPELDRAAAAIGVIDRLIDLRLGAVEELNALALRGRIDYTVVAELRSLVVLYPERPRFRRQLALALYRTNRQIEALDVLRDVRRDFDDEEGQTATLQSAILHHAPELEAGELIDD